MTPLLSVIVLNYNTRDLTLSCLQTLSVLAQAEDWQIIVVDNGSSDGSVEAIEAGFPEVELIASPANRGYAAGNNLGLRQAVGDSVILLNSDVIADAAVLKALAGYLADHPDVGAVSPRLLTQAGTAQAFAFGHDPSLGYLLRRGFYALVLRRALHDWNVAHPLDVDWISGACFCVRRSILAQVGLLDERFFLYFEDNEWCMRMRAAGWRVVYHPGWSVVHLGGASQVRGQGSPQLYYDSLLYLYQKHYPWTHTLLLRSALTVYRRLLAAK